MTDQADETLAAPPESDGARALAAAVTQIEVALREARAPVEKLGFVIGRMASILATLRATPAADNRPDGGPDSESDGSGDRQPNDPGEYPPEHPIEQLQADLYDSIQQLQFYDRMVQHLSHVQDYLSSAAEQLATVAKCEEQAEVWDNLRARLRTRLISDAQRELLDLVLPPPTGPAATRQAALDERARQGTVELF